MNIPIRPGAIATHEQPFVTREHPLCQEWPEHIARVRKAIRQRRDRDDATALRNPKP